jgi:hypothetical protein
MLSGSCRVGGGSAPGRVLQPPGRQGQEVHGAAQAGRGEGVNLLGIETFFENPTVLRVRIRDPLPF